MITGLGLDVKLICPVKSRTGNLIVEWSKDGEVVQSDFHRIKISGNMLRIKEARKDDGGRYKCTGVNGFGSESVFLDLIVLGMFKVMSYTNQQLSLIIAFSSQK